MSYKTIHYLSALKEKEIEEFSAFLSSGLAGNFPNAEKLFSYLKKIHPDFSAVKLKKETIFKKTFPALEYEDSLLRYAMSHLNKQLELFFSWKELNQSEIHSFKLRALSTRKLDKYFQQELNSQHEKNEQSLKRDFKFYKSDLELKEISYNYHSMQKSRTSVDLTEKVILAIDKNYFYNRLRYVCELLNRSSIFSEHTKHSFITRFIQQLSPEILKEAAINLYFLIFKILTNGKEEDYKNFSQVLKKIFNAFDPAEQNDLFAYAQNFCIRKINSGDEKYLSELFEWYCFQLENKTIFSEGLISQFDFKNIVSVALRLNQLNWTENFIEKQSEKLQKNIRENAYNYNKARLEFQRKEYKRSLKLLQEVEFTDIVYQLDSKVLLMKIYFENADTDAIENAYNSLKILVHRKANLSVYQKQLYINFGKISINLNRVKEGFSSKINLEEALSKSPAADIGWLRQKWKELN
ncbi:MAG: hypothetical protein H0V01_05700 [Bacteroidetes bacterium]|nr:hypothetical protein [Bacteroidota bacterium]HET6244358.1 hypothetical protein [Bacteroidia bacterium]